MTFITTVQLFAILVIFIKLSNIAILGNEYIKYIFPIIILCFTIFAGIQLLKKQESSLIKGIFFITLLESNFIFANLFLEKNTYISTAILELMVLCLTTLGS